MIKVRELTPLRQLLLVVLGFPLLPELVAVARFGGPAWPLFGCSLVAAGAAWWSVGRPLAGALTGAAAVFGSAALALADSPVAYPKLAGLPVAQLAAVMTMLVLLFSRAQPGKAAAGISALIAAVATTAVLGPLAARHAHGHHTTTPVMAIACGILAVGLSAGLGVYLRPGFSPGRCSRQPMRG